MSVRRGFIVLWMAGVMGLSAFAQEPPKPPAPQDVETGEQPNPALVVAAVDEPDMTYEGKVADRPDYVAPLQGGGYIFERKDAEGLRVGGVVVPGHVLLRRGSVELFGCGGGGKEHESIVRLNTGIQGLDLAFTSAGLRRGKLPENANKNPEAQGSRVLIFIQWIDKDGKLVTHRSEDLVVSLQRNAPMPRVGWTYVGEWIQIPDPTSAHGVGKHKVLAAAHSRSIITTFRDQSALLDNPLEEAVDDTVFAANYMLLPTEGTPVRVIFRSTTTAERKELDAIERKIAEKRVEFHKDDREK